LIRLTQEEAGPAVDVPEDIRAEVEIVLGRRSDSEILAKFADPVAVSCPSCGGVLSQIKRPPLRFRCQVGHAYTADALAVENQEPVDEALRVALRVVEERVLLSKKMADEARRSGRSAAAASYEQRASEIHAMRTRCAGRLAACDSRSPSRSQALVMPPSTVMVCPVT
jgi:two-component system chemotaxis response regulator CheB